MNREEDLVSIIIPMYNSSNYIKKTLESILRQTYTCIEVILIDDGSTDDSFSVAYEFCARNSTIHLFQQENHGVSYTRNKGIDYAKGKFICFVDADDIIDNNYIEILREAYMEYPEVDMVICGLRIVKADNQLCVSKITHQRKLISINQQYNFSPPFQHLSACGVLYKRELIENIRFETDLYIGEDALFHNQVLLKCQNILFLPDCLYTYVMHNDSAFKAPFSPKRLTEITAWRQIVELYELFPLAYKVATGEYCLRCLSVYKQMCIANENYNQMKKWKCFVVQEIRKSIHYVNCCKWAKKSIFLCKFACILPNIFAWTYCIYTKIKKISDIEVTTRSSFNVNCSESNRI